jgi:hypothetical protein
MRAPSTATHAVSPMPAPTAAQASNGEPEVVGGTVTVPIRIPRGGTREIVLRIIVSDSD